MKNQSNQKHFTNKKAEKNEKKELTANSESRPTVIDLGVIKSKIFQRIDGCTQISNELEEFEKTHKHAFKQGLSYYITRTLVFHRNTLSIIGWKDKIFKAINDDDFCQEALDTKKIVSKFLNQERISAKQRFYVSPGTKQNDFSIVDYIDENRKSLFFSKENRKIVDYYYDLFPWHFQLTIEEFEKVFFYFLSLTMETGYPIGSNFNDAYNYVLKVNQKVAIRFIEVENEIIQLLLFILFYDDELKNECERVYQEYERLWRLLTNQVYSVTS